jgi:hypothetical protein
LTIIWWRTPSGPLRWGARTGFSQEVHGVLRRVQAYTALSKLLKLTVLSLTGICGIFLKNYLLAKVMMKSGLLCQIELILKLLKISGVGLIKRLQDFNELWTDEKLYKKYEFTKEEIDFIESKIRPME